MTDVIGNWWRTADGEIVLLAANLTDKRQDIECRVFGTGGTMRLSLSPHELIRVAMPLSANQRGLACGTRQW